MKPYKKQILISQRLFIVNSLFSYSFQNLSLQNSFFINYCNNIVLLQRNQIH